MGSSIGSLVGGCIEFHSNETRLSLFDEYPPVGVSQQFLQTLGIDRNLGASNYYYLRYKLTPDRNYLIVSLFEDSNVQNNLTGKQSIHPPPSDPGRPMIVSLFTKNYTTQNIQIIIDPGIVNPVPIFIQIPPHQCVLITTYQSYANEPPMPPLIEPLFNTDNSFSPMVYKNIGTTIHVNINATIETNQIPFLSPIVDSRKIESYTSNHPTQILNIPSGNIIAGNLEYLINPEDQLLYKFITYTKTSFQAFNRFNPRVTFYLEWTPYSINQEPPCLSGKSSVSTSNGLKSLESLKSSCRDILLETSTKEYIECIHVHAFRRPPKYTVISKNALEKDIPNHDLLITHNHPILWNDKEILPKSLLGIAGIQSINNPESDPCYTIVTSEKVFVKINNIPVATWSVSNFNKIYPNALSSDILREFGIDSSN